jgi:hypothetical protein
MSGYREMLFWSPLLGSQAARLSMTDARGREFFAIVARESGKVWRERREDVLLAIEDAIARGDQPGEVTA